LFLGPARCKAKKSVFEHGVVGNLLTSAHNGSDLSRASERAYIDLFDVDIHSYDTSAWR
jgi:hypothetical protein